MPRPVVSLTINIGNATLDIGKSIQLEANVFPDNADKPTLKWSSSNAKVATVDSNGKVTAVAPGTAIITVATTDGSNLSDGCSITVLAPKTYTITYKLNGGKNNSKNPSKYTITTSTITLKNPTRKGYTFKGWYSDSKFKKKVTKIKKGSTGNIKLYAKWVKKK